MMFYVIIEKLEGKFCDWAIILAMLYGLECWEIRNNMFTRWIIAK